MHYTLLISCSPDNKQHQYAVDYARHRDELGDALGMVFFYGEGVDILQDLHQKHQRAWTELAEKLCLCSGSVAQQNIHLLSDGSCPNPHYEIAGLGEWIRATLDSDQMIHFGQHKTPRELTRPEATGFEKARPPSKARFALIESSQSDEKNLHYLTNMALALSCFDQEVHVLFRKRGEDSSQHSPEFKSALNTLHSYGAGQMSFIQSDADAIELLKPADYVITL